MTSKTNILKALDKTLPAKEMIPRVDVLEIVSRVLDVATFRSNKRCEVITPDRHYGRGHQCPFKAKMEFGGKHYCLTHANTVKVKG
jgi:hypothetical protein